MDDPFVGIARILSALLRECVHRLWRRFRVVLDGHGPTPMCWLTPRVDVKAQPMNQPSTQTARLIC
jgi:hypothetical protein